MRPIAKYGVRSSRLTPARRRRLIVLSTFIFGLSLLLFLTITKRSENFSNLTSSVDAESDTESDDESLDISDGDRPSPYRDVPVSTDEYPDQERPLPPRIDLTFYTTARNIDSPQLTAIRSWLGIGASVIVFVDNLTEVAEVPGTFSAESNTEEKSRLQILETPLPRSGLGAPRLDLLMEAGELWSATAWVCMINADIVIPKRFGSLISGPLKDKDMLAIGERLDCRTNPAVGPLPKSVNSFEDLERWSMAPCWPHGSGGKDYFLYRKGFFQRNRVVVPPFWIGKFVWDHWLVNINWKKTVDLTPSLLVGHLSHDYVWNWRLAKVKKEAVAQKATAMKDITWNQRVIDCENKPVFACLPHQSTYDAKYQLCPNGSIQRMPDRAVSIYAESIGALRRKLKPKGQEGPSRRVYQEQALTGSSPSYWNEAIKTWASEHGCA